MNINDVYEEFYLRGNTSKTLSKYCAEVFGIDLTQDGFADKDQLDFLISYAGIGNDDDCLDIGCGNGKIAQYIGQITKALMHGIDYSPKAINAAKMMEQNNSRLCFDLGDINDLALPKDRYTKILLIDSIYFSDDYSKTLRYLYEVLKPKGKLCIYYSEFVFEAQEQRKIGVNDTKIAKVIQKNAWKVKAADFNESHFELMKRKHEISEKYKRDFEEENNAWLYDKIHTESVPKSMRKEDFENFTNRYLYCIEKD